MRQTMQQYRVKSDMGLFRGVRVEIRFHWMFWKPLECLGGLVWFGPYVEHEDPS